MGTAPAPAHVLVFPWPIQGHLNVMLHLAVALAGAGVHVTFLHTDYNLRRLGAAAAAAVASPWLRFMSVTDGLPDDHPRTVANLGEISRSLHTAGRAAYRALLASSSQLVPADAAGGGAFPPVTTVVADALLPFAIDVAEELGVPALAFRTASACSFLAYMSVPRLVELGELPFPPGGDLDEPVRGVPGMEGFLRRRDLPSPCRHHGANNNDDAAALLGRLVDAAVHCSKARALILNTAASLEAPALAHIAPRMRDVFAVAVCEPVTGQSSTGARRAGRPPPAPMGAAAAHVLVFPMPLQGHINVMLHLATALAAAAGVHVTFLHTDHNLRRLGNAAAATTAGSPRRLRFLSVPDGLPDDHPRSASDVPVMVDSLLGAGQAAYRALLGSLLVGSGGAGGFPPVTSVVADALLTFAIDVAEELGVPALAFRTASASSLLAYMSVPRLFELGELPFPPGGDLDEPVRGVPGMEGFLRRRDLPSTFRRHGNDHDVHPKLQMLVDLTTGSCKARAVILNTAASLEAPALAHIAPRVRDVFAVGPLHAMSPAPAAATSLWREDDGCMAWLDGQADRSVVYVSLGSLTVISPEQFTEFLSGLVAAGHPFLWVLRPDMVTARLQHADLQEAVAAAAGHSKARVVRWAPQRDVLRHRAVGCFLTHAGWNSTLEAAAPALAHIAPRMRDVFAVGPLHAMSPAPAAATSLWRADDGCMAWLDCQADRSVVYVSLGSLTVISPEQFTEFLSGLVAAGNPFLWVLRPDMVTARRRHADLQESVTAAAGDSKARVVGWAPQRDVLRHRAVGCFLTHAGWNSTLEAAVEGVPTVCWPFFTDQQINSRFVGGVWRTGLDMKDVCDAAVVARMVREAMESGEIRASAQSVARQLRRDVAEGGSSATELKRLVGFIGELATPIQHAKSESEV
uniref:Uncharacterized protein n=1 Tax=Oryza glumipatula TaxID=40148 RepID=A0A0E0AJU0_9ORYZ